MRPATLPGALPRPPFQPPAPPPPPPSTAPRWNPSGRVLTTTSTQSQPAAGGLAASGSSAPSTSGSSQVRDDSWAYQEIGAPFPEKPIKVIGEQNQYVALWYKHGKPIHGRSWNHGRVVECSFPYKDAELKTKQQLEGQIQVLQYKGDHNDLGFWYNWIKYSERVDNSERFRETVRCGDSFPILWKSRPEGALLGYVDNKTEQALFSADGKIFKKSGGELNDMLIIVRELRGAPPGCPCAKCAKLPPATAPKEAALMAVSCDVLPYGQEETNNARIVG